MSLQLNPYLNFKDNARPAMEFYHSIFGGKLNLTTFKEGHAAQDPAEDNKIMHAMLEGENGIVFMAADTPSQMEFKPGSNIHLSLSDDDGARLKGYWDSLSDGAKIFLALDKAPWGDIFGMLTDQFGVHWMVNITTKKE